MRKAENSGKQKHGIELYPRPGPVTRNAECTGGAPLTLAQS